MFEGEISKSGLAVVIAGLKDIIEDAEDSVYIYSTASKKNIRQMILGVEKNPVSFVL